MFLAPPLNLDTEWEPITANLNLQEVSSEEIPANVLQRLVRSTVEAITSTRSTPTQATIPSTVPTLSDELTTSGYNFFNKVQNKVQEFLTETTTTGRPATESPSNFFEDDSGENVATTTQGNLAAFVQSFISSTPSTTEKSDSALGAAVDQMFNYQRHNLTNNIDHDFETIESLFPQALTALSTINPNATSCGRVNIMGTIVQDSAPYLYPFVIEYSLIGAAVIYVMWKHIGRYPK